MMDQDNHSQLNTYPIEFDEVDIKEEDDDTGEYDDPEIIREEPIELPQLKHSVKIEHDGEHKIDPKLLMSPIVYTTKLENMTVLHHSFASVSTQTVINKIVEESKPHFKHISINQNLLSSPSNQGSFRWVRLRVTQLKRKHALENTVVARASKCEMSPNDENKETKPKITDPVFLINAELLKMCKPCSIPLERVDGKASNHLRQLKNVAFENSETCLRLIIADRSINETDVYCVQGNVNTEQYRFKGVSDEQLMSFEKLLGVKKIDICCWYQREKVIVALNHLDFPENVKKVLKRPHFCPSDRCTCCCKFYKPIKLPNDKAKFSEKVPVTVKSVLPEDMEFQNLDQELTDTVHQIKHNNDSNEYKNNWVEDLLLQHSCNTTNLQNSCNTLINKALNYKPPKKETKKSFPKSTPAKPSRLSFQYKTKEAEYFELTPHGTIEMHAKLAPNSEFRTVLSILYSSRCQDYKFCCWKRRVSVIKQNFTTDDSMAELRRFLTAQHACAPGKCKCCCFKNYWSTNFFNLGDITLPERITPTHTVNVVKVTKPKPRVTPIVHHSMTSEQLHNIRPVLPYTIPVLADDYASQNTPVLSDKADDCMIVEAVPSSTNTNQGAKKRIDSNSIQDTLSQPLPKHTFQPIAPKIPISAAVNNETLGVNSIVSTILERFRNVRLTLNEAGEVAASLDNPVDSLTTAELKVLANILAHAQRQVQVIGLANSSKSAGTATVQGTIANNISFSQSTAAPVNPVTNTQVPQTAQPIISQTTPPPQQTSRKQIFQNFAQLLNEKNAKSLQSFTDYIDNKNRNIKQTENTNIQENNEQSLGEPGIPVIANVFSLKDTSNTNAKPNEINSALKSWTDETTPNTPTMLIAPLEPPSLKRKPVENVQPAPSKIRVVDPAKLGITKSFDDKKVGEVIQRSLNLSSGGFLSSNNFLSGATVIPPPGNTLVANSNQNQGKLFYLGKSQNVLNAGVATVGPTVNCNGNTQMTTLNSTNVVTTQTPMDTYRIKYFGDSVQLVPVAVVGNNTIAAPQNKPPITSQRVLNSYPKMI